MINNIVPTPKKINELEISKTINNLAALSERTWTVKRLWNDMDFINRAKPTLRRIGRYIRTV